MNGKNAALRLAKSLQDGSNREASLTATQTLIHCAEGHMFPQLCKKDKQSHNTETPTAQGGEVGASTCGGDFSVTLNTMENS